MNKAFFFDRDGVLNKSIRVNNEVSRPPWDIKEIVIFKLAYELIKETKKLGYIPIVVTNQPDIGRGDITYEKAFKINKFIMDKLKIDKFYICPHGSDYECDCRKPKPGMLIKASKEYKIDLKKSIMVGDREKDILAGINAGCKTTFLGKKQTDLADYHVNNHADLLIRLGEISNL